MYVSTLLFWLIIGGVAGWLAGTVMTGQGFGLVGNIAVGIVGAVLGGILFGATTGNMASGNLFGSLVVATISSIILLFLAGFYQRNALARIIHESLAFMNYSSLRDSRHA